MITSGAVPNLVIEIPLEEGNRIDSSVERILFWVFAVCPHCFCPSVPPLEGFVMNRVQGDYFETLLYKIFVSIDEQTNVAEVSATNVP